MLMFPTAIWRASGWLLPTFGLLLMTIAFLSSPNGAAADLYVQSVSVNPNPIYGGYNYTGTVTMGGSDAGAGGFWVDLTSSDLSAVQLPFGYHVFVPSGSNTGTWTFNTNNHPETRISTITATFNYTSAQTVVTVLPLKIIAFYLSKPAVLGGNSVDATIVLSYPLPPDGNTTFCTTTDDPAAIPFQTDGCVFYQTMYGGEVSKTFPINTYGVAATHNATIFLNRFDESLQVSAPLRVDPSSKSPSPGEPVGGGGGSGGGGHPKECLLCGDGSMTGWIDFQSGNVFFQKFDPISTRGYPLVCNISLNSQAVESNRPMGNATFSYDIHVAQQTIYTSPGNGALHWVVMDGDGTRLDFGLASGNPTGMPGIFSVLSQQGGGYVLSGAGPPEDVKSAGNFVYTFDSAGKLTQIKDPAGNLQNLTYTSGQLTRVLDVNTNKQITFNWTNGFISQVVHNGGAAYTNLTYTGGQLTNISVTNSQSQTLNSVQYNYSGGQLFSVTRDNDALSALNFTYTPYASVDGGVVQLANENDIDHSTNIIWGNAASQGAAETVVVKNAAGNATTYDFNSVGDIIKVTTPQLTGASSTTVVNYTYDANRMVTGSTTNGVSDGSVVYSSLGLPTSAVNQLGNAWSWSYLGADLLTAKDPVQNAAGTQETLTYADQFQPHVPTGYTDANGFAWNFAHNAYGQTTTVTPPNGSPMGATNVVYDETPGSPTLGYPLLATDANGNKVTFDSYDGLGDLTQLSTYTDPNDINTRHATLFGFDAVQRPTFVQNPDTTAFQWFYVGRNLDHTIDEAGTQFHYTYCAPCGALEGVSGPLGWVLGWTYNADKQLSRFTDARGKQTNYTYGPGNELTGVTYPDNTTLGFLYDNFGRVRQATNGRGQQIVPTYDAAERVSQISFPTTGMTGITLHYNIDDTLHDAVDSAGTTTYTYLPTGQVSTVIYNYSTSGLTNPQELDYTYFPDGSRASLTWKNNGTVVGSWSYSYDPGGRMSSVVNNFGETTSWTYDGEGKLKSQTCSNNTSVSYTYNELRGWPTSITYKQGATVFASYALTYDSGLNTVGNLTRVVEANGWTTNYTYDSLYRLTSDSSTSPYQTNHTYAYDLAGNITLVNGTTFATYDSANKIASLPGGSASYDGDGNSTNIHGNGFFNTNFAWDDLSRLTSHTVNNHTVVFVYDFAGRRIMQRTDSNVKKFFVFDGDTMIGTIQGNNIADNVYTWGPNGPVSDKRPSAGTNFWYSFGPQGETKYLTNSTGTIINSCYYSAYGVRTNNLGGYETGLNFGGQFGGYYSDFGTDAGVIYCRNRFYHPKLGRWLSRDPIGYGGGPNLYNYCEGDPINYIDPLGLDIWDDIQTVADVVGLYPGLNIPAEVVSGTISAFKGDGLGVVLSLGGLAPVLGDGAVGSKIARRAAKLGGKVCKDAKASGPALNAAKKGVYKVPVGDLEYVGQTGRTFSTRISEHVGKKFITQAEADCATHIPVVGNKTAREVAEQKTIDALGGIKGGKLANVRNPLSLERAKKLIGAGYTRP